MKYENSRSQYPPDDEIGRLNEITRVAASRRSPAVRGSPMRLFAMPVVR
jgi:hypothetical protein